MSLVRWHLTRRIWLATFAVLFAGLTAQGAQAANWIVNANDTGSDPTLAGGTISYNISVKNEASTPVPATTLTLDLRGPGTFIGGTGTITGCLPAPAPLNTVVTCQVPALAANATVNLIARVQTTVPGTVTLFRASVPDSVGSVVDTQPENNFTAPENTSVTEASDFRLEVAGPTAAVPAGSTASYTFTATNLGPSTATTATVEITPPTGLGAISVPPNCTLSAGRYRCTIAGPIAVNGTSTIVLSGRITAAPGASLPVTGEVISSSPGDPIPGNNQASTTTSVLAGSDLSITKSVNSGVFSVGETATFTLRASFSGNSPSNLTITDNFPASYELLTATGAGWSCSITGQQVLCTRASGGGTGGINVDLGTLTVTARAREPVTGDPPVQGKVPPDPVPTPVTNTASIQAASPTDPDPSNNSGSDGGVQIYRPVVDLRANKSSSASAVAVGSQFNYLISTSNLTRRNPSSVPFIGTVTMRDRLPLGVRVLSATLNGWSCPGISFPVVGPAEINCQRTYTASAPLAVGGTTPSIILRTEVTQAVSFTNELFVGTTVTNGIDDNIVNNYIGVPGTGVAPGSQVDLGIGKQVSLASVAAGQIQTFTIEVINRSTINAADVIVRDDLQGLLNTSVGPTGAGLIDAVGTGGFTCTSSGFSNAPPTRRLECTTAVLPPCTSGVNCPIITVRVRPGGTARTQTNRATVTSTGSLLTNTGDDFSDVNYAVTPGADVSLTKTASPSNPVAGQDLTYTLTARVAPDGRDPAPGVTITDTLSDEVVYVSSTQPGGSACAVSAGSPTVVTCSLGTIANGTPGTSGSTAVATITVRPKSSSAGRTVDNSAVVSSAIPDDNSTNNSASVSVVPRPPVVDLIINKTVEPDPTSVGGLTNFRLVAENLGPSAATNVVVTDLFPARGLTYEGHTVDAGGTCSAVPTRGTLGGQLVCSFPTLLRGERREINITMEGVEKGVWLNEAEVRSDEESVPPKPTVTNNRASQNATVRSRVMLVVDKTVAPVSAGLGEEFIYTIDVTNEAGRDDVTDVPFGEADAVALIDTLQSGIVMTGPPVASVIAGTTTLNICPAVSDASSFTCRFGTMSSGARVRITFPARVDAITTSPQPFTNTATVETTSLNMNDDPSDTADVTIVANALSGVIFRDFDDNGVQDAGDTGIAGVGVTLEGTTTGGSPVTLTVTTDSEGRYSFPLLTPGNYTLTRDLISGSNLREGRAIPGAGAGGSPSGANRITGLAVTTAAATGYNFTMIPQPVVAITKALASGPDEDPDGTFTAGFSLEVRNDSLEELSNIAVTDLLAGAAPSFGTHAASISGLGQYSIVSPPSGTCGGLRSDYDGSGQPLAASGFSLAAGASCTIAFALRAMPVDPLPPVYENQARVAAEGSLSGLPSTDESEIVPVSPAFSAAITLTKSGTLDGGGDGLTIGDTVAYTLTVENTGTVNLSDIGVSDPKLSGIQCPATALAPGAQMVCTADPYVITEADFIAGQVDNTADVSGRSPAGAEVTDSDSFTAVLPQVSRLAIDKVLSTHTDVDGNGFVSPGDTLAYTATATNTGNTMLSNVVVSDDKITPASITCASVAPGGTCVLEGSLTVTIQDAQAGQVVNTATADSNETDAVTDSVTTPVRTSGQGNDLSKTALDSSVKRGERVPFVIRALDVALSPVRIVDIMPPGFTYVAGSARANGAAVEPVIDGRRLMFEPLVPDADADITLELTLLATSAAATGENVNRAELVNPATGEVLDTARARVTILEEAVFDCSDIIGKVFDDRNRNGYQDEGEPGLPGVRLATVKGLLVTTDPNGRFSVACADIPDADIGSNFIMKLDPRTLPTGYRVTTENPRKVRLTRGKIVKLNFGAAITRLVSLDLNAKVFEQGSEALKPKWQAGLARLVEALGAEPSTLRITYVGEDGKLAKARIRAVSREIQKRWKDAGGSYRLSIESSVVAAAGEVGQ